MTKTIRKTYPKDFSIGILIILFTLVFFLAGQLFEKTEHDSNGFLSIYLGELLVSTAVIIMVLILWEEFLFPVTIKPEGDGLIFRNHRTKLKIQALTYLSIPAIVAFLYFNFEVNTFRFFGWAGVVMILPVIGRLISGINNYNDFLTLTSSYIEYKNNEKEGRFEVEKITSLQLTKGGTGLLQKLIVSFKQGEPVTIDLDEMELEDYFDAIEEYVSNHYETLVS